MGPQKRPLFFQNVRTSHQFLKASHAHSQVATSWQWCNMLHDNSPAGMRPLRVNMDETSVCMYQSGGVGLVSRRARRLLRSARPLAQNISRGQLRACLTHAALLCDDRTVQHHLPQMFIAGKSSMTQQQADAVRRAITPPLELLLLDKGWMNTTVMCLLAKRIRESLPPAAARRFVILTMDAHRSHYSPVVLRELAAQRIAVHFVPAKATWIMQPCDTHLFAQYKAKLAHQCQQDIVRGLGVTCSWDTLARGINWVVHNTMAGRDWWHAFAHTGLVGHQEHVSDRLREKLQGTIPREVGSELPSLQALLEMFPRNSAISIGDLFAFFTCAAASTASQEPAQHTAASTGPRDHAESGGVWFGRLRSSSRLTGGSPAPSTAASCAMPRSPPREPLPPAAPAPVLPRASRISRLPRRWLLARQSARSPGDRE